jgi:hypothetical protein
MKDVRLEMMSNDDANAINPKLAQNVEREEGFN